MVCDACESIRVAVVSSSSLCFLPGLLFQRLSFAPSKCEGQCSLAFVFKYLHLRITDENSNIIVDIYGIIQLVLDTAADNMMFLYIYICCSWTIKLHFLRWMSSTRLWSSTSDLVLAILAAARRPCGSFKLI